MAASTRESGSCPTWCVFGNSKRTEYDMTNVPQTTKWDAAAETMRSHGATVVYPLNIPQADVIEYEGENFHTVACECGAKQR